MNTIMHRSLLLGTLILVAAIAYAIRGCPWSLYPFLAFAGTLLIAIGHAGREYEGYL